MKKLLLRFQDIDIKLFYFLRHFLFIYRVRIYIIVFLLIVRALLMRTPYLNVFFAYNRDAFTVIFAPLFLILCVGFSGRRVLIISVLLFVPLAILTFLGHDYIAEQLANIIYGLLVAGVLILFLSLVRGKNDEE